MPSPTLCVVFDLDSPLGCHGNQRLDPRIVPGARIPPMCRIADEASLHRVVMDIVQLLSHYRLGLDDFWVTAFLPELIPTVALVPGFVIFQALEQSTHMS